MRTNYLKIGVLFFIFIVSCSKNSDEIQSAGAFNTVNPTATLSSIQDVAPHAVKLFNINPDVTLEQWKDVEDCLLFMYHAREPFIKYFTDRNIKLDLTTSFDGGCPSLREGSRTVEVPSMGYGFGFLDRLFHIYQYSYYGDYDNSYGVNIEFEAKTFIYLTEAILSSGGPMPPTPLPIFGSDAIRERFLTWIDECVYYYENQYGMGIQYQDYVDFLTDFDNANNDWEYNNISANPAIGKLGAMFDLFQSNYK